MTEIQLHPGPDGVKPSSDARARRSRWLRRTAGVVALLGLGTLLGWAIATILTPPKDVLDSTAYTYVEVVEGEVGSSITLSTVAEWTPTPVGTNQAVGIVTSVAVAAGQEVSTGATLYSVNLRPVVVARGEVPAFRSLASGTVGADVAQLQAMLAELGLYQGAVDGKFGSATARAVRAWQRGLGTTADGVVQVGDIVFVPTLPSRVSLDAEVIERGASLSGGERVVGGLPAEPKFTIPVTESQATSMPLGTRVEITGPGGETWDAYVAEQTTTPDQGGVTVSLKGKDEASICGAECDSVPVNEPSLLRSRIVTVEAVVGLVVPAAALQSDPSGRLTVVDEEGLEHDVKIVASAKGMAVITGIDRGTMVRVPAEAG